MNENTNLEIIKTKALAWVNNPLIDETLRREIQVLINQEDWVELTERFYKDIEFGTGGMRSIIGAGNNRINEVTISRAMHSVCLEIKTRPAKVVISYDSRHLSFELAQVAAEVAAAHEIEAFLFSALTPVPILSFAIRELSAQAGIMITASHNPPKYNGFKVFWNDGCQVTPPYDLNIVRTYEKENDLSKIKRVKNHLIKFVPESITNLYFDKIKTKLSCQDPESDKLSIVYTPIHGSGLTSCLRILDEMGFKNVHIVESQRLPDGRFPTVKVPNPEMPEALSLAVQLLIETHADLAMATDPDCDRLGVALIHEGKTVYLNGNQIGILKLHYLLTQKPVPAHSYIIKSIVTSNMLDVVAERHGVAVENTLTGFKWICGRMNAIEQAEPERNFLFGTEESFGYLNHPFSRDKDGVASVALMAEVALFYKKQNKNLIEALDQIYESYGYTEESLLSLDYFGLEGVNKIANIMTYFRTQKLGLDIKEIKDYQKGIEGLPKSNVLGIFLNNGDVFYLRPSGTEPKIKFYFMAQSQEGNLAHKKITSKQKIKTMESFVESIVKNI